MVRFLVRVAFASGVLAPAIDVRRLFHCLTLRAAVLASHCGTRANWVRALVGFLSVHLFPPDFKLCAVIRGFNINRQGSVFLYRKGQIAILVVSQLPKAADL